MCLSIEAMTGIPAGNGPGVFGNPVWARASFHCHFIPLQIFSDISNEEGRPCFYQVTTWKQITVIYHLITIRYCIIFSFS